MQCMHLEQQVAVTYFSYATLAEEQHPLKLKEMLKFQHCKEFF